VGREALGGKFLPEIRRGREMIIGKLRNLRAFFLGLWNVGRWGKHDFGAGI
jgi:hypothetical protein